MSSRNKKFEKPVDVDNTVQSPTDEGFNNEHDKSAVGEDSKDDRPRMWTNVPLPGDDDFDESDVHVHLVLNEWASGTSIHGVAEIADFMTWQLWKRVLWFALVGSSAGLMIWQITRLIQEYQNYEVVTDTETLVPEFLDFPEVTICNMDKFSFTLTNVTGIGYNPSNQEELEAISTPLDSFIEETLFNDDDLSSNLSEAWKPTITDEFGRCWSFRTTTKVRRPGYFGGLYIGAWLDQEDYAFAELAGIAIFAQMPGSPIHDQLPFIVASPGTYTVVSLEKTEFHRERELPWSRCSGEAPGYTLAWCRVQCLHRDLRNRCGCRTYGDSANTSMRYCVEADDPCRFQFVNETGLYEGCSCSLPPCKETTYTMTSTSIQHSEEFYQNLDFSSFPGVPTREEYQLNFVGVIVNYNKLEAFLLTEKKDVTRAELLGSIGGSMGLFLGISALSVFEVFGDLTFLRLLPRIFGFRNLHGLGARS